MIQLHTIDKKTFLKEYWQKKPLVIRNALPNFTNPLSPDELAGLSLEEDMESRVVIETPGQHPQWQLKRGPFTENDFTTFPKSHWTLLVQGVEKVVPEVYALLDHFDFIPQWRIDDVMISYAALHGSVGPHFDNYDVFLYQAQGTREWRLTTQACHVENYVPNLELRIMQEFGVEETYLLEEGDMLYLPPHVGHYGISLSEDCMTYSFGYRSYAGQELLDSLGEYLAEHQPLTTLYKDPDWSMLANSSELPSSAWKQAQELLIEAIHDENRIKSWFGSFATRLDQSAEQHLPMPLDEEDQLGLEEFLVELEASEGLERDPCCRFAYIHNQNQSSDLLFINGSPWECAMVSSELIRLIANHRFIKMKHLQPYLDKGANQQFLYDLWTLQWLHMSTD